NVVAGSGFTIVVTARDNNGVLAENFGSGAGTGADVGFANLAAAVPANGRSAFDAPLPAANFVTNGAGTATFVGVKVSDAANGYTFNATSTSGAVLVSSPTSNAFDVTFATLAISVVPNLRSGDGFNVTVTAKDANNNTAENFGAGNGLFLSNLQAT